MRGARSDVADDAGDRAVERLGDLAAGDAPAVAPEEQQLSLQDAVARARVRRSRARAVGQPGSRTRSAIGAPATTVSPAATNAPIAGRQRERDSTGPSISRRALTRPRSARGPLVSSWASGATWRSRSCRWRRSRLRPLPQRCLPGGEQVAPAIGPVGQPQRDVPQVDEQPAEPAGDVDREVAAARRPA